MNPADATSAAELDRCYGSTDEEPTFICTGCAREIAGFAPDDGRCGTCRDRHTEFIASAADPRRA